MDREGKDDLMDEVEQKLTYGNSSKFSYRNGI
jgi:hypothetical protein